MIIKFFGILDLYAALILVLFLHGLASWHGALIIATYLIIKGFVFKGSIVSFVDLCIGSYAILMLAIPIAFLTYVFALHLAIKGVLSLL